MPPRDYERCCAPYNFSWVVENELAAMGWPRTKQNLVFLAEQGIKHLITLSEEMQPPQASSNDIEWTLIPVEEFEAPGMEDIERFIQICGECKNKNMAVGVHCRMGNGRTGTMVACYLVRFQGLTADRAITNLRLQRPGSVETTEQERAVRRYYDKIRGIKSP